LRIEGRQNADLTNLFDSLKSNGATFEVCAEVANLNDGWNQVRILHPGKGFNQGHILKGDQYKTICSKQGQADG